MTRSRWIIFAVICLGILGFAVFSSQKDEAAAFTGDPGKVITEGPIADHAYGNKDNKVILIEYGDLQCPACRAMFPTVTELKERYKNELTFVYRNFPLTSIHPNALAAATAAEAAGLQGKFFEMHDLLYQNQGDWSEANTSVRGRLFEQYATRIGLNLDTYKKDLSSSNIADKISRDRQTARKFSVSSTPTFVLDGKKLPSETATSPEKLTQAVEEALQKAGLTGNTDRPAEAAETTESTAE